MPAKCSPLARFDITRIGTTLAIMKNNGTGKTAALKGRLGMVMDRIGGFTNLGKAVLDKFQGSDRTDASRGKPLPENATPVATPSNEMRIIPMDKADISGKAHRLNDLRNAVNSGREALEDVPEVRQDRVAEVRARLNRGFYNSVEIRASVAEKLNDVARTLEDL